jgi:hypothetical protein
MSYTVRHIIDTDVDTFWKLSFDQELARVMLQKLGNQGEFIMLEERVEGPITHRRIEWRANSELPELAKKLVGDGTYTEIGRFDAAIKKYSADCVPKVGGEKFLTHFEITAEPVDGGARCERVITTENTIKVFGIGAMLAKLVERGQRDSHDEGAKFLNEWIREHPSYGRG